MNSAKPRYAIEQVKLMIATGVRNGEGRGESPFCHRDGPNTRPAKWRNPLSDFAMEENRETFA